MYLCSPKKTRYISVTPPLVSKSVVYMRVYIHLVEHMTLLLFSFPVTLSEDVIVKCQNTKQVLTNRKRNLN